MGVAQAKWDLLAAKEDFRINGQFGPRGYLGEELNVDNQYLNLVVDDTVGGDMSTAPDGEDQAQEKSPAYLSHADIHDNGDMSVGGEDPINKQCFFFELLLRAGFVIFFANFPCSECCRSQKGPDIQGWSLFQDWGAPLPFGATGNLSRT